jgi:hypothetical protein
MVRRLIVLVLFGVSFGYVEAAVVVYLRTIDAPFRRELFRDVRHDAVFPLPAVEQLYAAGPDYVRVLRTELGRELATLVMLAAVGMAVGRTSREWLAGFVFVFGVWDIFYYVFLKLLIGWPASLWTWDALFLLPVPWAAPVIAPVLVSASIIVAGGATLWRESRGRPVHCGRVDRALLVIGGLVVIVAFCWDFRHLAAGGWPHPFNWPLFALGEATGTAGFMRAFGRQASA